MRFSSVWLLALGLAGSTAAVAESGPAVPRSALRTIEGSVVSTGEVAAEGSLPVVTVVLEPRDPAAERVTILLAPRDVLDSIGFEIASGDVFRARIFVVDDGPAKVHKVMNLTRDTMVRLRTLHQIPLWDGRGEWSGGGCRRLGGRGGPRNRGGHPRP